MDEDEDEDLGEDSGDDGQTQSSNRRSKKPETEEEKRKNFLERNRQGNSIVLHNYSLLKDIQPPSNVDSGKKPGCLSCKPKSSTSGRRTSGSRLHSSLRGTRSRGYLPWLGVRVSWVQW